MIFISSAIKKWKFLLSDLTYRISLLIGILVFVSSYALTVYVSFRNDILTYTPVGDLFLDLFPTYNLEFLFTYGIYFLVFINFIYVFIFKPESAPFVFKTFGLLFIFRSAFVGLTHFGPPSGFFYQNGIDFESNPFKKLIFKNDLFFSGHTAIPFMSFLIFKDSLFRWLQLVGSIIMGITVLLMHVHYSIDVFSAFFITYGIYSISDKLFNNLNLRFTNKLKLLDLPDLSKIFNSHRKKQEIQNQVKEKIEIF
jgi:hypothetical protein